MLEPTSPNARHKPKTTTTTSALLLYYKVGPYGKRRQCRETPLSSGGCSAVFPPLPTRNEKGVLLLGARECEIGKGAGGFVLVAMGREKGDVGGGEKQARQISTTIVSNE